ncbi:hypothetical protein ACHAWF_013650 [Thalassiosira exigua]
MTSQHSESRHDPLLGSENPQEAPAPAPGPLGGGDGTSSGRSSALGAGAGGGAPLPSSDDEQTFVQKHLSRIVAWTLALLLVGTALVLLPYYGVKAAANDKWNEALYWTAGSFVLIAVPVSVYGIVQHLVNYYMPQVQKYVIRILFMVPIFSIQAWFSLFFHGAAGYIRAFRELYEAFVLSSFVYYIVELLGGEDQLALTLRTKDPSHGRHVFPFSFLCGQWRMGRPFAINCKYGVLQYVLVKILATIVVVVLQGAGKYEEGRWAWDSAYAYVAVVMNVSIGYALYCLVKLYYATKEDLKEWNPVWKFLCIKGIVSAETESGFRSIRLPSFSFWRGCLCCSAVAPSTCSQQHD